MGGVDVSDALDLLGDEIGVVPHSGLEALGEDGGVLDRLVLLVGVGRAPQQLGEAARQPLPQLQGQNSVGKSFTPNFVPLA